MGRKPHKADCQCVVCKEGRAKAAALTVTVAEPIPEPIVELPAPIEVRVGSLPVTAEFLLNNVKHRVATKDPEVIVCHALRYFDYGPLATDKGWTVDKVIGIDPATMVKPVK